MTAPPSTDRFLDLEGQPRLRYRDDGYGPAVLLVHGWLLDLTMFDALAGCMVGAGFRVVRWDRRGFGASAGTPSLGADVADGLRLLAHLGLGSYAVLGMSQGCRVALALVESALHRASCLVLDGPPPLEGLPDRGWQDETPALVYRDLLRERGVAALRSCLATHPLLRLQTNDDGVKARLADVLARYEGADLAAPDNQPIIVPDNRLSRLRLPVLVLNGEFDTPQRLRIGEALAETLPDAARYIVPASGHLSCWDNPAAYNRCVIEFLSHNSHRWA